MRNKLLKPIPILIALAGLGAAAAQAAAPAEPQGIVDALTYDGNQRLAVISGAAPAPDGVYFPGIAELPFTGYEGLGSAGVYSGDPDTPPGGDIRNNYTMHLRFYWYAPKAGRVQFAIASDDPGNLFVSTDGDPAKKVEVATEPQWNPVRDFAGGDPTAPTRRPTIIDDGQAPSPRPQNWSQYFTVTQGQILYVEAVANEGGGGDNLAVARRYDNDPDFTDDTVPINSRDDRISSTLIANANDVSVLGAFGSPTGFTINLRNGNGGAKIANASVKVQLDGADVTTTVSDTTGGSQIKYAHTGIFASGSTHKVKLTATDSGGKAVNYEGEFKVAAYGLLGKDIKIPDSAVNKNAPGFRWRVFQNGANQENTNVKTENALAGALVDADGNPLPNQADPAAQGNAKGPGKALGNAVNALVEFEIETVVNWDQGGGSNGAFTPDEQMPGIPGLEGSTDGIAGEVFAYIEFPQGLITMGVNSDDGFKTTGGLNPADAASAVLLGEFNGGRGAADTIFTFVVEEAGIYCIRTTWEEGGGGANIEWFTVKADGTKVLVNDTANGGLKAYRSATVVTPAALVTRTPAPGAFGAARKPVISAVWSDPGGVIDQASVKMKVNGADVVAAVSKAGDNVTASYTPAADFGFDETIKVDLAYKNAGRDATATWSFATLIDLAKAGTLFIETEDWDFDGGKTITDQPIGMTGKYPGGSFRDKGDGLNNEAGNKSFGVDYNEVNTGSDQAIYRPGTGVEAGKEDSTVTGGLSRGSFDVEKSFTVGWNDGGDWMNYTRTFPTPAKNYRVFGRLSSGGAAINVELAKITAGVGTKTQTKEVLGFFRPGRATSGWDGAGAFETFPLIKADGTRAVVNLGGTVTLRYTTIDGNNDNDFLIFQETTDTGGGGDRPKLTIAREGNNLSISWTGGTLQVADDILGPWTDVAGATSPRTVALDAATADRYWRARQ